MLHRDVQRAKRRHLYKQLIRDGMPEAKARRVAKAIHGDKAPARRTTPIDPAKSAPDLWIPPSVRNDLRKELSPLDRVALRLKDSLRLTSEIARKLAEESFRRVDVSHAKKEEAPA